mmetsp:Transcript_7159/g.15677  ORF Transcript_7159/g.15677 Transcript_7159/m.15677 type:complete len:263 (-) Transcript_7159:51-839(-)
MISQMLGSACDFLAAAAAGTVILRQAATAMCYTRAQLGFSNRQALFSGLCAGQRVLEVGPGEAFCHCHYPSGLHYTSIDPSATSRPPLPVKDTCANFREIASPWQKALPDLLAASRSPQFDAVVVVLPSTILFGPETTATQGALRTAFRVQRPRAEWEVFARLAHLLLEPGGTLLVADVWAQSWLARLALPIAQWRPPLSPSVLLDAGFSTVETVVGGFERGPMDAAEVCLRAHKARPARGVSELIETHPNPNPNPQPQPQP